ncbi:MAG: response regulator [Syntrophobacteraceae bacterium]|nr:response regulator [Syntrophobacteraceae bacterium]
MAYKDMVVLVVDDFSTMRRIVKSVLRDLQFKEIVEAENGAEALAMLKSVKVDLIVSDWNMPVMTGLEFLKKVRADEQFKSIPFIMVTAEAQKDNIIEAVKAKVSNYVVKPFTPASLAEKIAKVISQS